MATSIVRARPVPRVARPWPRPRSIRGGQRWTAGPPPAAAAGAIPASRVEVALDTAPGVRPADDQWTRIDVTNPLVAASVTRGYRIKTGEIEASEIDLTLDNANGELVPGNSSSPYTGLSLRTRMRVVLEPPGNSTVKNRTLCHGLISRIPPVWGTATGQVDIALDDLLTVAGGIGLPRSVLEWTIRDLGAVNYWPFGEEIGLYVDDIAGAADGRYLRGVTPGDAILPYDPRKAQRIGLATEGNDAWRQIARLGATPIDDDFTIVGWVRFDSPPAGNVDLWNQQTALGAGVAGIVWLEIQTDGQIHGQASRQTSPFIDRILYSSGRTELFDGDTHMVAMRVSAATAASSGLWLDDDALSLISPSANSGAGTTFASKAPTLIGTSDLSDIVVTGSPNNLQLAHVARFDRVLSDAELTTLYSAGVDAWDGDTTGERLRRVLVEVAGIDPGDVRLDPGRALCGPATIDGATVLDYTKKVVNTEGGGAVFTDGEGHIAFRQAPDNDPDVTVIYADTGDVGTVPFEGAKPDYSLDRVVNVVEANRDGGRVQRVENTSSIVALGGELTETIDTAARTPGGARSVAQRIVFRSGGLRLVVPSIAVAGHFANVPLEATLDPEILDCIEIIESPPGSDVIDQRSLIEQIAIILTDVELNVSFGVQEIVVFDTFQFDTAGRGWDQSVWGP